MPSTVIERDALLEATVGNLGLLVSAGRISSLLAGPIAVALVQADDAGDLRRMRWIAGEVERGRRMFAALGAEGLTPEARSMGTAFTIATLRAILAPTDAA